MVLSGAEPVVSRSELNLEPRELIIRFLEEKTQNANGGDSQRRGYGDGGNAFHQKGEKKRNPVAKHSSKFNRPTTHRDRAKYYRPDEHKKNPRNAD